MAAHSPWRRALRKGIRPLRRALNGSPAQSEIEEFDGPVLVLIAHPDDEIFCSGLILKLAEQGQQLDLLSFTRGEGGEHGSYALREDLASIREKELNTSAKRLGVRTVGFLDYAEPSNSSEKLLAPFFDEEELVTELSHRIANFGSQHLITHGSSGEYWHPAHLALHRIGRRLNRKTDDLTLWTFNSWHQEHSFAPTANQDDPTSLIVDVGEYHEQRLEALAAHKSQKSVFERFVNGSLKDYIAQTRYETYRRW